MMVRSALELVTVPAMLVMTTEYVPTLVGETALIVRLLVAEPEILLLSVKLVPLSRH